MKKILLLSIFFMLKGMCSAQTNGSIIGEVNNVSEVKNTFEKTLIINTNDYSLITFESLKDELISWKEKVKSAEINESARLFTLVHFPQLENRELFDVLNKYNIKKTSIVSYK